MYSGTGNPLTPLRCVRGSECSFLEQFFDLGAHVLFTLRAFPAQFALPAPANDAFLVDEINGRPVIIEVAFPHRRLVVHGDGERQLRVLQLLLERLDVLFALGFWRVDADDHHVFVFEILPNALVPRVIADAIDSTKRHEVDDHDLALEFLHGECRTVDPFGDVLKFWSLLPALDPDWGPVFRVLRIIAAGVNSREDKTKDQTARKESDHRTSFRTKMLPC
jgi:hypothetical protein